MQHHILICGNYGAGNLGDELILKGLLKVIGNFSNVTITVTSGNPEETRKWHGVKTCPFMPSSFGSWMKNIFNGNVCRAMIAIRKSDLIIFGGGGLFNEKEERSIRIWNAQVRIWKWLKKKIVMVGQSFDTIKNPHHQKIIREVCASMKKICVRDTSSKKNLEELGVKHQICVLSDSALWLTDEDFNLSVISSHAKPYALINLRTWSGIEMSEMKEKIQTLVKILEKEHQLFVKFIAMQKGKISDRFAYDALGISETVAYIEPENLDELWNEFTHASRVVAMRLHACILAVLTKKPFLAIAYDAKVKNLLADLGKQDSIINTQATENSWIDQLQKSKNQPQETLKNFKADEHTFKKILTKSLKSI